MKLLSIAHLLLAATSLSHLIPFVPSTLVVPAKGLDCTPSAGNDCTLNDSSLERPRLTTLFHDDYRPGLLTVRTPIDIAIPGADEGAAGAAALQPDEVSPGSTISDAAPYSGGLASGSGGSDPFVTPDSSEPQPEPASAPESAPEPAPKPAPESASEPASKPASASKPTPNDENPGIGGGFGPSTFKSMAEYATTGRAALDNYATVIKDNIPDVRLARSPREVSFFPPNKAFFDIRRDPGYHVTSKSMKFSEHVKYNALKSILNFHKDTGLNADPDQIVTRVTVTDVRGGGTINEATYSANGDFIVLENAFKENDNAMYKVPLNEMGMQTLLSTLGPKAKNLKAMMLSDIQNREFWYITRNIYDAHRADFTEIQMINEGAEFDSLMGSPNLRSKWIGFANHHQAIGNPMPSQSSSSLCR